MGKSIKMKKFLLLPFYFLSFLLIPVRSQDHVNLFDYWKYYSDVENSKYKTSCTPAFITSTVAGAIEKYDLPDLMAALCPRKLLIMNPLASDGSAISEKQKTCYLTYA
jgi:hypothetical protein